MKNKKRNRRDLREENRLGTQQEDLQRTSNPRNLPTENTSTRTDQPTDRWSQTSLRKEQRDLRTEEEDLNEE
jgi:hypothetical protein